MFSDFESLEIHYATASKNTLIHITGQHKADNNNMRFTL